MPLRGKTGLTTAVGGGAAFLLAYREPQRSEIMDWMFKPDFGASLQILKVEVGSDDQVRSRSIPATVSVPIVFLDPLLG